MIKIIGYHQVMSEALKKIEKERLGENVGLMTRWIPLNKALGKYFRFNQTHLICGSSGSGKSFILTMLRNDFFNIPVNKELNVRNLHFSLEMPPEDEGIRAIAAMMKESYSTLISSEMDANSQFKTIEQELYNKALEVGENMKSSPIDFVVGRVDLKSLRRLTKEYKEKYKDCKILISIDHSLLIKKDKGVSDFEMSERVADYLIDTRDENTMVIVLSQLNNEIKKPERLKNKAMHYPMETDIYGAKYLKWAVDNVLMFHRPELLNLDRYGVFDIPTQNLIHCRLDKVRYGTAGDIFFTEDFKNSSIKINKEAKEHILKKLGTYVKE